MIGKGELVKAYLTYISTPYELPTTEFMTLTLFHVVALCLLVYFAYRKIRLALLIKNTPTTTIRSAPQGYVEINGLAKPLTPLVSPLSNTACVWWSYEIEEYAASNQRRRNSIIKKESYDAFIIKDKTSECIIHPEGSLVIPHHTRTWYGDSPMPTSSTGISPILSAGKRYRYKESILLEMLPTYCLGMHQSLRFDPANLEVGDIIRKWKKQYAQLVHKYDANKDGQIDVHEWKAVLKDAEKHYQAQLDKQKQQSETSLTIISEEGIPKNKLFVISGKTEKQLLKETMRHKVALMTVTTLLTAHILYALLTKALF